MPAPRVTKEEVLEYHARNPPGKLEVSPTKPTGTQRELSLAYTPGVAQPCLEIQADPEAAYRYTAKGNLVAVVTNGTAVLGLGNIGALSGKPVMEGKAVLFKKFAGIDVFDLEVAETDPEKFIETVRRLEPTFGGVNLEDIKAPECFVIEERLRREMKIPVFHDDQHGTAIISGAALLNACEVQRKELAKIRIVVLGAGAAGIACARFYVTLGARRENIVLVDSKGVVYRGRAENMNRYKEEFAQATSARTLADALRGADVFVGLSGKDLVSPEMVRSMAERPIVFAMANPDPEIAYEAGKAARPDVLMATGRSDTPNQINNVLGYPFIFRGALDCRATEIDEAMKVAAARALAALAREDVPDSVLAAYGLDSMKFGSEYIIPKPLDPRVMLWVAPAVAKTAMEAGVARKTLDLGRYRDELEARLGKAQQMMRIVIKKAKRAPRRIVYPEGENEQILRAVQVVYDENIARPVLIGRPDVVNAAKRELGLDFVAEVVDPRDEKLRERWAQTLFSLRARKGVTLSEARAMVRNWNYVGALMLHLGDADGLITGLTTHYQEGLRPCLQVIGTAPGANKVVGLYMMTIKSHVFFFADATVNIDPSPDDLAEIAIAAAKVARQFDVEPRVAMLSFSNFGSSDHPLAAKVRRAVERVRERAPHLVVDGEMQADTAVVPEILRETYAFSRLKDAANVLVFPDLEAANVSYKLLQRLADAEATGPILAGMRKPVHILQRGDEVKDVVNMTAIAVVGAQEQA